MGFRTCLVFLAFLGLSLAQTENNLQFFNHMNYGDLVYEDIITTACKDLPARHKNKVTSIKNPGGCIILYSHGGCTGREFTIEAGEHERLEYFNDDLDSFRACDEVDTALTESLATFYTDHHYGKYLIQQTVKPECTNLPGYAINTISSVDTNACIELYSYPDCVGSRFIVRAGEGYEMVGFNDDADSFKPCDNKDVLLQPRLSAEIKSFQVTIRHDSEVPPSRLEQMTSKSTFFNNGSATIRQEYVVTKSMKEIVDVQRSHSLVKTHDVNLTLGVSWDFTGGIPIFAQTNIKAALDFAYRFQSNESWSENERYSAEYVNELTVSQEISIPACTQYEVSSFVETMRDYPIEYVATVELIGKVGKRVMTAQEIREAIHEDFNYVSDKGETTVVATTTGTMAVDFAINTSVNGDGAPLEGCLTMADEQ